MSDIDQSNEIPNGADETMEADDAAQDNAAVAPEHEQGENDIDFILDIPLEISVVLGQTKMLISDLLKLGQGSIVELTKLAGETLEVLANQKLIARGEVVSVDEKYGIRITEIVSPMERIKKLK